MSNPEVSKVFKGDGEDVTPIAVHDELQTDGYVFMLQHEAEGVTADVIAVHPSQLEGIIHWLGVINEQYKGQDE